MDINRHWYRSSFTGLTFSLLPLSFIFQAIVAVRRAAYRFGLKRIFRAPVPVIVVGNITVGGTGKTPFVIWLANHLKSLGYQPGIVSRGYGGLQKKALVQLHDDPAVVGDESLLLARQTLCPVMINKDRVQAVKDLLAAYPCDVIISDDGLQHYRLGRQIEIAIVDGIRRFGNGSLLPAGPLREPISRLHDVDFIVAQQQVVWGEHLMTLEAGALISLANGQVKTSLQELKGSTVHAVAGIGNPARFFSKLRNLGLDVVEHAFPDHHLFCAEDLDFNDTLPVIMTEKDAVKCYSFATDRHWYLPVVAKLDEKFQLALQKRLPKKPITLHRLETI